jgi:hypothetical protein
MFAAVSMAGGNFGFISNSGYDTMRYQSFLLHLKYLMPLSTATSVSNAETVALFRW